MKLTEAEYREHCRDYDGYCTQCDDVTSFSGVEPDAENYPCELCETDSVCGVEQALLLGKIEIVEGKTS